MTQVIIHAGPGKTGTSAVQRWLNLYSAELLQLGVLYPLHTTDANQVSSGNVLEVYNREADGELVLDEEKLDTLLSKCGESGCGTLLLSSEFFFFKIIELNEQLPGARFVAYLRDPIEQHESGYNQGVKRHGQTKACTLPERFSWGILGYLKRVLRRQGDPQVVLRPYVPGLFRGGNVVNDFLETIGIDLRCDEDTQINASYGFEALEFKRHANHFPLGPLEHRLDEVLQRCPVGDRSYSLTSPARYEAVRLQMLGELDAFMKQTGLEELVSLRRHLAEKPQRPYRKQQIDDAGLEAVAAYLRDEAPELYAALGELVRNFAHLALPNPHFYACFGARGGEAVAPEGTEQAVSLVKALEAKPWKAPDMAREIAFFFERRGDLQSARLFMEAAYRLRPHGDVIRKKLNEYREKTGEGGESE